MNHYPKSIAFLSICLVCMFCSFAIVTSQSLGPEFRVNTWTDGDQTGPSVTIDGAGKTTIVWTSVGQDGDGCGIYAQRYDATLLPSGSEFRVNTTTDRHQLSPSIEATTSGDLVVAWRSNQGLPPDYWELENIFFQRYDSSGAAVGGETLLSDFSGTPELAPPSIALSNSGAFEVYFATSMGVPWYDYLIIGQEVDASGNPVGSEWTKLVQYLHGPKAAGNGNGDYVLVWHGDYSGMEALTGFVGGTKDPEFQITPPSIPVIYLDAAINSIGEFVIVWGTFSDDSTSLWAQRFDSNGDPVGAELQVKDRTDLRTERPAVAMLDNGDFLVVWDQYDGIIEESTRDVFARRFSKNSGQLLDEFQVNDSSEGYQSIPAVAAFPDGRFLIAWSHGVLVAPNEWDRNVHARELEPLLTAAKDRFPPVPSHRLSQNFPNPFGHSTTIDYWLESPTEVTIRIYNALGMLVRSIPQGYLSEGKHTARWDGFDAQGNRVSSGTYFYELRAGGIVLSKKMLLVR